MIAYLLLVHNSPRQVARLVHALQGPNVAFFIHVDRKVDIGQFRYMLRHHKNVKFVRPRYIVEWGGWRMVQAELLLMRYALKRGASYMVLMSGMDYPVWCNRRIHEFFNNTDKNFIEHYRIPSRFWDRGALNRIRQFWVSDDPINLRSDLWFRTVGKVWRLVWHKVIRKCMNLGFKLLYELGLHRRMPHGLTPYVGSQWWAMSGQCGQYVIKYMKEHPEVVRFYKHSHVPDESFIQSIVLNSPFKDTVVNTGLRYVEWDGGFNPRILERNDLNAVLASGCAFTRKVVLGAAKELTGRTVSSESLMHELDEHRRREEQDFAPRRSVDDIIVTPKLPVRVPANGV